MFATFFYEGYAANLPLMAIQRLFLGSRFDPF